MAHANPPGESAFPNPLKNKAIAQDVGIQIKGMRPTFRTSSDISGILSEWMDCRALSPAHPPRIKRLSDKSRRLWVRFTACTAVPGSGIKTR
jgi:hypothetical protein